MPKFTPAEIIAMVALIIVGALAMHMIYVPIPVQNHDYLVFLLGGLTGALTVGAGGKAMELSSKSLTTTTVNAPAAADEPPP